MSTTLSCGQCGAPLRAEQDWCSLCYASVEPEFDPLTAPLEEVMGRSDTPELPETPAVADQAAVDMVAPVRADRVSAPPARVADLDHQELAIDDLPVEVSDVDVMLSMLAAEHRQSDPAAGIAERLSDRSTRVAVMVGGMVLIGAVVFLVLTVLGAFV